MEEKFVWTIDLLRKLVTFNDRAVSLKTIVKSYFRYNTSPAAFLSEIREFIIKNELGFGVEEDEKIIANPITISDYLTKVTTNEYLVDRCFDLMYKEFQSSPVWITKLFDRQGLKPSDNEINFIEAQIIESGLVDANKS